jgi:hypothetical protein
MPTPSVTVVRRAERIGPLSSTPMDISPRLFQEPAMRLLPSNVLPPNSGLPQYCNIVCKTVIDRYLAFESVLAWQIPLLAGVLRLKMLSPPHVDAKCHAATACRQAYMGGTPPIPSWPGSTGQPSQKVTKYGLGIDQNLSAS